MDTHTYIYPIPDFVAIPTGFSVYLSPSISATIPSGTPVEGASRIRILGAGFAQVSSSLLVLCKFGNATVPVASVQPTQLVCAVPASASPRTVLVYVTLVGRTQAGSQSGYISSEWSLPVNFSYYVQPVVDFVVPWDGYVSGGSLVTLVGSGFAREVPGDDKVSIIHNYTAYFIVSVRFLCIYCIHTYKHGTDTCIMNAFMYVHVCSQ